MAVAVDDDIAAVSANVDAMVDLDAKVVSEKEKEMGGIDDMAGGGGVGSGDG